MKKKFEMELFSSFESELGENLLRILSAEWCSVRELSNRLKKKKKVQKIQTNPQISKYVAYWHKQGLLDSEFIIKEFERTRRGKKHLYRDKKLRYRLNLAKFFTLYFEGYIDEFCEGVNLKKESLKVSPLGDWSLPTNKQTYAWFKILFDDEKTKNHILYLMETMSVCDGVKEFFKQWFLVFDAYQVDELKLLPNWFLDLEEKFAFSPEDKLDGREMKKSWIDFYTSVCEKIGVNKKRYTDRGVFDEDLYEFEKSYIKLFTWFRLFYVGNLFYDLFGWDVEEELDTMRFFFLGTSRRISKLDNEVNKATHIVQ